VNRWFRLAAAVVAMMMISNLQYAWTLFVKPLVAATHWKLSDVQYGFTLFVIFQTWVMPCSGWLIDRLGPRTFMTIAGLLCGFGWTMIGHATTIPEMYAFYSLAGFGAALVYCGSMGIALKWFSDYRGLAAGLISAGYGSGAALFTYAIGRIIREGGYRNAFLYTGIVEGLVIVIAAQFLKNPEHAAAPVKVHTKTQTRSHAENFNSLEMLRTPHFYMLFSMALMMGIGGLMVTAQVAPMADTFKIGAAALSTSLFLNPLANGGGRLFWGWVSDHIGREIAMFIAFLLQSVCLLGVVTLGHTSPVLFIVSCALVFFTWGEVYSLFPSASADFFGTRHASSNYAFIYSAKGVASILGGGLAAALFEKTGSWNYGFYVCSGLAVISAVLALVLRKMPMPVRTQNSEGALAVEQAGG
jgi:OFA family oxalate/formate antiporter-like MFS transporter